MRTNFRMNSGVRFELLSQDQLQELFDGVLHVLEYTGLDVYHDEARDILKVILHPMVNFFVEGRMLMKGPVFDKDGHLVRDALEKLHTLEDAFVL